MDRIRELLDEQIESEILTLDHLAAGSDQKTKVIANLETLYKLRVEDEKVKQIDAKTKNEKTSFEKEQKQRNLDRWLNVGLQIGLAMGGWLWYDHWHRRGLKFEETGTYTSPHTRNLLSRMLPGRK